MGVFGKTAIDAVELILSNNIQYTPLQAWEEAIKSNTSSEETRKKGCSKATFIGLCDEGYIKDISANAVKSNGKNKRYAIEAADYLLANNLKIITIKELWQQVNDPKPMHENGQMDIVITLRKNKLLINP